MQVRKIPEGGGGGRASSRPPPTVSSHLTNPPLEPSQSTLPMVSFLLDESRREAR